MASFFREWKRENSIPFTNANVDLASTTEKKDPQRIVYRCIMMMASGVGELSL